MTTNSDIREKTDTALRAISQIAEEYTREQEVFNQVVDDVSDLLYWLYDMGYINQDLYQRIDAQDPPEMVKLTTASVVDLLMAKLTQSEEPATIAAARKPGTRYIKYNKSEPISNEPVTLIEHEQYESTYGFRGNRAIVKQGEQLYLICDAFGGIDTLAGGAVRWQNGMVVKLQPDDTLGYLKDTMFSDEVTLFTAATNCHDPERPVLQVTRPTKFAKAVGLA